MTLTVVTEPSKEPVTAQDARTQLDISGSTDILEAFITGARQQAEAFTGRAFITQTLRLHLETFPRHEPLGWWDGVRDGARIEEDTPRIALPRPPLQSVDSITYQDTTDTDQTFDASKYLAITTVEPGEVQLKYGETWPTDARPGNAVQVEYVAGYGPNPSDVPQAIRRAILVQVGALFNRRTSGAIKSESIDNAQVTYLADRTLDPAVKALLQPYRIERV